jgi:flagellar biosynthesis chaperone FliJ
MPENDDLERRLSKLEAKFESAVEKLNKINQTAHDRIVELEKNFESAVGKLNKINKTAHDHIVALEKKVDKTESSVQKVEKQAEPRNMERDIRKIVEEVVEKMDRKRK